MSFNRFIRIIIPSLFVVGLIHAEEKFSLKDMGDSFPVDYGKYGDFNGRGTSSYKFKISDRPGLAEAVGSGIFPNVRDIYDDPEFKKWKKKNPDPKQPWDYVNTGDPQAEFYVWASAPRMSPGAKLYFTGEALSDAGLYTHALKAYYAALVHFPSEPVWSADHSFVWYIGPAALRRIETITKRNPDIGYRLFGAVCTAENDKDTDLNNDVWTVDPGEWRPYTRPEPTDLSQLEIIQRRGDGKVQLLQFSNKHWQLQVDGKPMMVKAVNYSPTPVGSHVQDGGANKWMFLDTDESGKPDAPYESYLDLNANNKMDGNEKRLGDFEILKQMGANAIKIYRSRMGTKYDPSEFNKDVLRDLYLNQGMYVILGDFLGAYTVGSGADWNEGTDYTDKKQLENMRSLIREYVEDHREEPYVLMWILGNENLMPSDYSGVNATRTKASTQIQAYLEFVNEIAEMIHELDPDHPVAVGNLGTLALAEHNQHAPAVDIMGINSYIGSEGFGDLWKKVKQTYDKPVLIAEYGCDAWNSRENKEDEIAQAIYHQNAWEDIELSAGGGPEDGNSIGGIIFEYLDEWWKSPSGSWETHDTAQDKAMAFPDGWSSEEWLGVLSQGDGEQSPFLRRPRKVYNLYKDKLWAAE